MSRHLASAIGGVCIGVSAAAFAAQATVAGICGIGDAMFRPPSMRSFSNLLFATGLIGGPATPRRQALGAMGGSDDIIH